MKPPSTAQLWARERNWNKARMHGMLGQVKNMQFQASTLISELKELDIVRDALYNILKDWNSNLPDSKFKFIKASTIKGRRE